MRFSFYLLGGVIGFQMILIAIVVTGCVIRNDHQCSDGKAGDLMAAIVAQSFALYAAESRTGSPAAVKLDRDSEPGAPE